MNNKTKLFLIHETQIKFDQQDLSVFPKHLTSPQVF
jgi:hypothetical protein